MTKTITNIKTLQEAEEIRLALKAEGFTRVGISGQTGPKGEYTGLFVVTAQGKKVAK